VSTKIANAVRLPAPTWSPVRAQAQPAALALAQPQRLPATRPAPLEWTAPAPVGWASPLELSMRQQAAIMVASLMQSSLATFDIVAAYGRILVVDLQLPQTVDPRLALAVVDYGVDAPRATALWRHSYDLLRDAIAGGGGGDYFYSQLERTLRQVAALLAGRLEADELEYWRRWWMVCLALPQEAQPELARRIASPARRPAAHSWR
jgi:hypothetical protein